MPLPNSDQLAAELCRIAHAAGDVIMAIYRSEITTRTKADASPVTDADEAAERLIIEALEIMAPEIPIVAEERAAAGQTPEVGDAPFWLVDPLDGTKEFISRNGDFTVNIALIRDGVPVEGVVHAPAVPVTYFTKAGATHIIEDGGAARPITVRSPDADGMVAVVSRSHYSAETADFLADYTVKAERAAGSSLKFGLVASGAADLYPRLGRTMEWDTAAGHAVVLAAGGSVRTLDGLPLRYGKPGFENPHFVVRGVD
jgi:3'(2'), 5'-bisphosphate nucleotidase